MKTLSFIAAAAVALTAPLASTWAQPTPGAIQQARDRASHMDTDRVAAELSGSGAIVRDLRGRQLSAGQVMNGAKAAVTTNSLDCQVTEAALRGVTNDKNDIWEVACQSGAGYMLTSPRKEEIYDCAVLGEQAKESEAQGQKVPVSAICILKANRPKP